MSKDKCKRKIEV